MVVLCFSIAATPRFSDELQVTSTGSVDPCETEKFLCWEMIEIIFQLWVTTGS